MTEIKYVDLHVHSTASDGTYTPSEIIEAAEQLGLAAVALTDHDTVSGLAEFKARAAGSPVKAIQGVEIAAIWKNKEIHIIGYWIDPCAEPLLSLLSEIRSNRDKRNLSIIEKLNTNGYVITLDEVKAVAGGESIGRPHIASILVAKGYFKTIRDVFDNCLARGSGSYSQRILPEPQQVIDVIHSAGGIAFWAHPVHRRNAKSNVKSDLIQLTKWGLDGVEAYYSDYLEYHQKKMLRYAGELNIQVSGGSDFHGTNQPDIKLGTGVGKLFVPESVYENMVRYYESRRKENSPIQD